MENEDLIGRRLEDFLDFKRKDIGSEDRLYSSYIFRVDTEILMLFLNTVSGKGYNLQTCISKALFDWTIRHG
jgi:hypothetical protein